MPNHVTDIDTVAHLGVRVRRAGCLDWEDVTAQLVTPGQQVHLPEGNIMRAKCVSCAAVNAISAHEGDEGEVGWGCEACGQMQTITPATLNQKAVGKPTVTKGKD